MKTELLKVLGHETLTQEEARQLLVEIVDGQCPDVQISALLTALVMRGVTVDELLGLREGILQTGRQVGIDSPRYIDIVGTGGDGKNTFNISTAACFVVAGAGYKVVKHGNYSATSVSGASNVMEKCGAVFSADSRKLQKTLALSGMAYLHAPLFATAMKHVASVRRQLSFPTVFNLLGPIANPSNPSCQLLGVATLEQMRLYSQVYNKMGIDYAIVNSLDGYDEISLTGEFKVTTNKYERIFRPEDLGFARVNPDTLRAGRDADEALEIFNSVLDNTAPQACRDVVVANAAFAIHVLERLQISLPECVAAARRSLEDGHARRALNAFIDAQHE